MLLTRLAAFAYRAPKRILLAALVFLLAGAVYATPVITDLPSGGYDVPESESVRAETVLNEVFSAGGLPVVFAITAENADNALAASRAHEIVHALQGSAYAHQVISYWTAPPPLQKALVSDDGRTGLVVARMEGGDRDAPQRAHDLAQPLIGESDGVKVTVGGQSIAYFEGSAQSRRDLVMLEAVAVPLTALALIWIFGSLVAASLPLLAAAIAVVGTGACLWTIHQFTDVSIFAVNLATALGLAFAVDYTLFILSRYREERGKGLTDREALIRTMNTAGRTVIYSGLTMALTIATLFVFEPYLLRSLAYAGIASVGFATAASLCVAPALLVFCGDRIDSLDIRPSLRKLLGRKAKVQPKNEESSVWYRLALWVMRRPAVVLLVLSVALVALATPLLGIRLSYPDDRALPSSAQLSLARVMGPPDCQGDGTTVARYRGCSSGPSGSSWPGRVRWR
ncbi:MMPL family transporter [Mycobacterium sp. 134]|uniref:MMPL family transporter n=1 Tax=Mycobacterium sp. 134 TaxID=3400425 RepID=UPI003AAC659A